MNETIWKHVAILLNKQKRLIHFFSFLFQSFSESKPDSARVVWITARLIFCQSTHVSYTLINPMCVIGKSIFSMKYWPILGVFGTKFNGQFTPSIISLGTRNLLACLCQIKKNSDEEKNDMGCPTPTTIFWKIQMFVCRNTRFRLPELWHRQALSRMNKRMTANIGRRGDRLFLWETVWVFNHVQFVILHQSTLPRPYWTRLV